jgi:protein-tyrosine phosphatase
MSQRLKNQRQTAILFVCLGNICRSPTAEGVLRHVISEEAPELDVEIDSAGTGDYHVGDPPDARTQRAALRRGIDLSGLRARRVIPGDFSKFDLILAMDRQNLRDLDLASTGGIDGAAAPVHGVCAGLVPRSARSVLRR